jgi:hypothetical protein
VELRLRLEGPRGSAKLNANLDATAVAFDAPVAHARQKCCPVAVA